MADPIIMAANERWKSISRTLFTLGSALIAAACVKGYNDEWVSIEGGGWLLSGFGLMFVGWKVLEMLESET